mgnify:FL=1
MRARRGMAALALAAGVAGGVAAGAPAAPALPSDYRLEMDMRFLGMSIGRVELEATAAGTAIEQQLSVETTGIVERLTGYRSEVQASGRRDGATVVPSRFSTLSENKRATREVRFRYDAAGRVVDLASFKRGRPERTEVPPALRHDTIDPLTLVPAVRAWLFDVRDAGAGAATTFAVFDGRRRYDIEARLVDRRVAPFADGPTPIIEATLTLVPRAGFDDDDSDTRRELTVLVGDDALLLPLILRTAPSSGLQAALYTRRLCTGGETPSCRELSY